MKDQSTTGGFALRGIRVLDFTWIHAGPSATRILSDQGAQVIKVESDQALSVAGGPASSTARGLGQRHNWNSGKLSISMNMKTPDGASIAKRLVAVSDVVSKFFCGRVMPGWGMDYESIRQINPGIIMLSMSGFGRTGPWRDWVSYGQTLQALGQPAWAGDQRFSTAVSRWNHAGALDPLVESWTLQRSPAEVMELLQAAGIAAGVVQTGADLAEDPQLKHRGFLRQVLDQQGVPRTIESAPYKLSLTPGGVTRGSPEFGAHQTFVLRDILGMSDDELAECAIAGVFE